MASFSQWLKKQVKRNDPIGDLAGDYTCSKDKNPGYSKKSWLSYLYSCGACYEAIDAFEEAWEEFTKSKQQS
jgi:hypothetical protein